MENITEALKSIQTILTYVHYSFSTVDIKIDNNVFRLVTSQSKRDFSQYNNGDRIVFSEIEVISEKESIKEIIEDGLRFAEGKLREHEEKTKKDLAYKQRRISEMNEMKRKLLNIDDETVGE